MKKSKNILLITMLLCTITFLTGCQKKKENKSTKEHNSNPIATMQVEYENNNGEQKQETIKIELYPNQAPETVENFVNLVNNDFYNNLTFHRIIENFMIQGGDPAGNGSGTATVSDIDKTIEEDSDQDYSYSIKGEFSENNVENNVKFEAGTIAMARSDYSQLGLSEEGYNSGSCQFFIMNTDDETTCEYLQGNYSAFGKVIEGYDTVLELSKLELKANEQTGEASTPVKAPIIKSITVDTFGEEYKIPNLINADETIKKVNETYLKFLQQYYGINDDDTSDNNSANENLEGNNIEE